VYVLLQAHLVYVLLQAHLVYVSHVLLSSADGRLMRISLIRVLSLV
jgi:hypothetical protein